MRHFPEIRPYQGREESVLRLLPDLLSNRDVLYVGARSSRIDFGELFAAAGMKVTVLEIHRSNVEFLGTVAWIADVVEGDVRTFSADRSFDLVFWWHGPEHIREHELRPTLQRLEAMATNAIVLGCPWGRYLQGREYGNPHEVHLSHFDHGVFEMMGYETECLGRRDTPGSNITAVKELSAVSP